MFEVLSVYHPQANFQSALAEWSQIASGAGIEDFLPFDRYESESNEEVNI